MYKNNHLPFPRPGGCRAWCRRGSIPSSEIASAPPAHDGSAPDGILSCCIAHSLNLLQLKINREIHISRDVECGFGFD